ARRNPSIVPNLDRSNEGIVDAGPDVAPDDGAALLTAGMVGEVGRDVAGADVRPLADLGVADVRGVRHLRAAAEVGVLDLDERVGELELALRVPGVEPVERAPERRRAEDVRGGVQLPDRALLVRGVPLLDDAQHASRSVTDDAAVREGRLGLEREERGIGVRL